MTAVPPLPPEIQQQQQPQQRPLGQVFAGMGNSIPDPISVLKAQIQKLEDWTADTVPLLNQVNPALTTLMVPIAQAAKALIGEIDNLEQRFSGQSPQVSGSVPTTIPGNSNS